jgi:hypothetical protein
MLSVSASQGSPPVKVSHTTRRRNAAGQALVIMALAMVAVTAMVGLIIDGGNAWANQRIVQNGSDAAAEAGSVIMAERLAGATAPGGGWEAAVATAVNASATANGITVSAAYYTDICGIPLKSDGSAALNTNGSYDLAVADHVGSRLPAIISTTPNCPNLTVGPAAGVLVVGHKDIPTYFVGVVGINTFSVNTQSTAAAGYLQESCDASQGQACALLPVAIPVDILTCDRSGNAQSQGDPWVWGQVYVVPLCKNDASGNVGWLNWGTTGTAQLIKSIQTPNNPAIQLPSWQNVTLTGNTNSQGVEDAIRAYDGQIVMIPQFDLTCGPKNKETPDNKNVNNSDANYGCLNATTNDIPGSGTGAWYRIPSFAYFQLCISSDPGCSGLEGAYINGSDGGVCGAGNGSTGCLVGKFVSILSTGTIGPGVGGGTGNSKAIGVQLIK